jgi:very-short-patch-repair endonuclease
LANTQNQNTELKDSLRIKVRQLYSFLKEANQIQFRPIRVFNDQTYSIYLSEVPRHPSAQIYRPVKGNDTKEILDVLIRVARPNLTQCPKPPESCIDWLNPNWDDPYKQPSVAQSRNKVEIQVNDNNEEIEATVTESFFDDLNRTADYKKWIIDRSKWIEPEVIARGAMQFFEKFYSLYSRIEKDGERLELLIGDGFLSWIAESGVDGAVKIIHPILFKRVELRFNPNIPEFTVHDTDRESELYSNLFIDLKDVDASSLRNRIAELETSKYHPLGWEDTSAYLKSVALTISPTKGEFLEDTSNDSTNHPRIWRDPVIFLRKRVAGISNAVDKILDDIDGEPVFPRSLSQITGEEDNWKDYSLNADNSASNISGDFKSTTVKEDILLVNEANEEQIEIVKRLDRSGSVVVQGPPGTGKTHTISNLIGHLLAQGKSILVTSHTAKALRVLRDKVPDMLKPLCVSVLGNDQQARRELESSVSSITERLTSETLESLTRKSENFYKERVELTSKELKLKHQLREAIENEYTNINLGGKTFTPAEAARFVAEQSSKNNWLPSRINQTFDISSKLNDINRLYSLNSYFSSSEESDSRLHIPLISHLPTESDFCLMVSEYNSLITEDLSFGKDKWVEGNSSSDELATASAKIESEFNDDLLIQSWRPFAIVAGIHGAAEREVWQTLISKIELVVDCSAKYALLLHHKPILSEEVDKHKHFEILQQITAHIDSGGKLNLLQTVTKPGWRKIIKSSKVSSGQPSHKDHFNALKLYNELIIRRVELEELWNILIGSIIHKPFKDLGSQPEQSCRSLIPEIKRCLDWYKNAWEPIVEQLRSEGLKISSLINSLPRETSQISEYKVIEKFAKSDLNQLLQYEISRRKLKEHEDRFFKLRNLIINVDPSKPNEGCISRIVKSIEDKNTESYAEALAYLRRITSIIPLVKERDSLIQSLSDIAPNWSNLISQRVHPHDQSIPPGDIIQAWLWRQLNDILDDRHRLDVHVIQQEIEHVNVMLREVTRYLVDARAWSMQIKRLQSDNAMRQALVGWLDTAKRLASTRQLDKRLTLLSESRKLMLKCSEAVPVWIMPISLVAENFDPQITKFDVVIIDEASQADINALIPLYMGKQIIVVGDHEQVTPLGVGKDQTILENLRKSMLKDIPNSHLYDNMSSIYDLARQSFGEGVRLVEHFRCVPEIIGFSNALSYEGKIRPLRESNSSSLKPSCVPFKVNGIREQDVNKIEATEIISLVKAMIAHDAYRGKTIGIISMLGESQATLIQSMLHKEINSVEIEKRRIQSGISGEFQGDERDIILLSMVDSAIDTNPLRTTGDGAFEQTKKRYNVAASRARDQLWVVHSFDPDLHLKSADLRFRLLQHVRDPLASARNYEQEVNRTESPFEKEVLKRLTNAGFRVTTQVQVGYFRIDMVVEGNDIRLAVECDGDRYHPIEKLADDMNRQSILERLGWKFVRIRGSSFYRDADLAMKPVFKRLEELNIMPLTKQENVANTNSSSLIDDLKLIISREANGENQKKCFK